MVGDECSIGEQATIAPHVRIYPFKRVEMGAQVQRSLIWQPRGASTLFTDEGVTGIVNVDITPETATRLAMAYGTTLRRGDQVVVSRDAHPGLADDQARDDRRHHRDRGVGRGPARGDQRGHRFELANTTAPGGIHVKISDRDPERIQIMFFEGNGILASDADAQGASRSTSTARSCAARCSTSSATCRSRRA